MYCGLVMFWGRVTRQGVGQPLMTNCSVLAWLARLFVAWHQVYCNCESHVEIVSECEFKSEVKFEVEDVSSLYFLQLCYISLLYFCSYPVWYPLFPCAFLVCDVPRPPSPPVHVSLSTYTYFPCTCQFFQSYFKCSTSHDPGRKILRRFDWDVCRGFPTSWSNCGELNSKHLYHPGRII